jgi:hypothetical protein
MQAKKPAFEQPESLDWNALAEVAAQPALAVDAATRPQDRGYFESWIRPNCRLDLVVRRG